MTNLQSKDIDRQICLLRFTYKKTCQKTTNWVRNWLGKLGKWTHGKTKTRALKLCHEDIMNMHFGLMTNHRTQMADVQSRLLRILQFETLTESDFYKWN